jgi:SAM-dependent methyltransferase
MLEPAIAQGTAAVSLDEDRRETALSGLRHENFRRLLAHLGMLLDPAGCAILDVGCAHGWFLEQAAEAGFRTLGIEPDAEIGGRAAARGLPVRHGFFPDALEAGERFDVIAFNDVFEHLANPIDVLGACRDHLVPGGLLVINLPSSEGVIYAVARVLLRLGVGGPFERLWQTNYPSPHLSYFAPENLRCLCEDQGFREIGRMTLPSFHVRGLWQRLRFDTRTPVPVAALQWIGVALARPVMGLLPADISVQVFRLDNGPD